MLSSSFSDTLNSNSPHRDHNFVCPLQLKPAKITVHTNTLDHPAALPLYQKLGFVPVAVSEGDVEAWE